MPLFPNKKTLKIGRSTYHFQNLYEFFYLFFEIAICREYAFKSEKSTPIIVDCGTHIGLSVLFFKNKYKDAKIYAFEPSQENLTLLQKNIENNHIQNVEVIHAAVGQSDGEMTLYTAGPTQPSWGNSLNRPANISSHTREEKVSVVRLSRYLNQEVDFVKMDIEGAEVDVFAEINEKLRQVKEFVVEIHNDPHSVDRLTPIVDVLRRNGFQVQSTKPLRIAIGEKFDQIMGRSASDIYMLRAKRIDNLQVF